MVQNIDDFRIPSISPDQVSNLTNCMKSNLESRFVKSSNKRLQTMADAKRTPSYSLDLHFISIIMQLSNL